MRGGRARKDLYEMSSFQLTCSAKLVLAYPNFERSQ